MGQWVVTVAGIAILSVLCDVILPDGQTRKYVKTVFGVVVSLVIISPIVTLFSNGINADIVDSDTVSAQQGYLDSVAERQNKLAISAVKQQLEGKGVSVKSIRLNSDGDKLTLELATFFSDDVSDTVERVVKTHFPNVESVIIWGSV